MTNRTLTLKSCAVRGPAGKSAYDAAVEAGYEGTADEYYALIGGIPDALEHQGTQISALEVAVGDLNSLHTTAKNNLVDAINEAAEMGGGLDLSDLIMSASHSSTEGFSTLTLSDGTESKSVDIPVASLSPADITVLTNIVNDYLDDMVNGDEVSY